MPVVWIPSLMRDLTGGVENVHVAGKTLRQVIRHLDEIYPGMMERLCNEGLLRPNIAAVVDGQVARRTLLDTVREDSEIHFVPAISGGCWRGSVRECRRVIVSLPSARARSGLAKTKEELWRAKQMEP